MLQHTQIAVAQLDAAAPPPAAVRLFPFGVIKTRKGTFTFTRRSAQLCMKMWGQLGREFGFDYEHGTFDKNVPPKERVASGWGKVELRKDGLWVTGITWTPDAARKIAAKEFRYLSAALLHNKQGEIVGVENCALTNLPATLDAEPLVLSALPVAGAPGGDQVERDQVERDPLHRWAQLGGPVAYKAWPTHEDEAWDAAEAERELQKWAGVDQADPPEAAWRKYSQGFAYVSGAGDRLQDYHLPHHRVQDGHLVTSLKGVEAAGAALQGAHGTRPDIPEAELPAVRRHLAAHYHQFKRRAPWETPTAPAAPAAHLSGMADDPQTDKHKSLARTLRAHLAQLLSTAQTCSTSDHAGLKEHGADLAGVLPEHIEGVRTSFPDLGEDDDDELDDDEREEREEMSATVAVVEKITGQKGSAARIALLALAHNNATAPAPTEDDEKKALVDKMIKVTKQARPAERKTLLAYSLADLKTYAKIAKGDKGPRAVDGAEPHLDFQPTGKAPGDKTRDEKREKVRLEALSAIGVDPKDPRLARVAKPALAAPVDGAEDEED